MSESLSSEYFDVVYAASSDPWNFETSEYERTKYADTLESLPAARYECALEIGCSIGVLTRKLATRCNHLLATDVSEKALLLAAKRCHDLPQVTFRRMQVPAEYPRSCFDLTVLSEVGYYWDRKDLAAAADQISANLAVGGHLLLVHWTPLVADYPLTGDQVHDFFLETPAFIHIEGHVRENYRLDLFARMQ
jgi:SAM-dependent methyltransferase